MMTTARRRIKSGNDEYENAPVTGAIVMAGGGYRAI
jgi:hypothetical protein